MPAAFPINSDEEFYPFLKASLPTRWRIEANPPTGYFSESHFNYTLFPPDALSEEISGSFQEVAPGVLIARAQQILNRADSSISR